MAIGFGIIGCGMISEFHARAIADVRDAKLVACLSRSKSSAERFAKKHLLSAYADLDEFLANPGIDVVTICTPSGAHMEPAVAAATAGKHVIVEKPLEITLKRCDQIIDACKSKIETQDDRPENRQQQDNHGQRIHQAAENDKDEDHRK